MVSCGNILAKKKLLRAYSFQDVCFSRVEYLNGHLGVSGGCSDYTSCMTHETANADKCRQGAITQCHYCSLGKRTNRFDVLSK